MPIAPLRRLAAAALVALAAAPAAAQNDDLAAQLANPVASLISVPFQYNYDRGFGVGGDGDRHLLNIQPVVPFDIAPKWNLISRTILPVARIEDFAPGAGVTFGLGDVVQSAFFSPKAPTSSGWIWGAGPVFLVPTATDDALGSGKFGIGPTGVALRQSGRFMYGALANHIWSVAGEGGRQDVNATFLQPFVTYLVPGGTTFFLNTETTYDWNADAFAVPINAGVTQLTNIGGQAVQFGIGARYWVDSPPGGPEGWGLRLNVIFAFPTGG